MKIRPIVSYPPKSDSTTFGKRKQNKNNEIKTVFVLAFGLCCLSIGALIKTRKI